MGIREHYYKGAGMYNRWSFPTNQDDSQIGISDSGIETFREDMYSSLARETCQNSMDAKLGDIEVLVLQEQGFHKRALISPINGMKIFDMAYISTDIPFATIARLVDEDVNAFLRVLEPPAHDKWVADLYEKNKSLATRRIRDVRTAVAENVCIMKSDGERGWVEKPGYPGGKRIKKSIMNYMEGGVESFKHKIHIYDEVIK